MTTTANQLKPLKKKKKTVASEYEKINKSNNIYKIGKDVSKNVITFLTEKI